MILTLRVTDNFFERSIWLQAKNILCSPCVPAPFPQTQKNVKKIFPKDAGLNCFMFLFLIKYIFRSISSPSLVQILPSLWAVGGYIQPFWHKNSPVNKLVGEKTILFSILWSMKLEHPGK